MLQHTVVAHRVRDCWKCDYTTTSSNEAMDAHMAKKHPEVNRLKCREEGIKFEHIFKKTNKKLTNMGMAS
jgi:hypothetical protein